MFKLNSIIRIGKYEIRGGVNDVKIKKDINVIVDSGTLKIPAIGRVHELNANLPVSSVETARLFREGDKVKVELGYNGRLKTEFEGFVRRVNLSAPVTIDIEGYAWQLRKKTIKASWRTVTLRKLLEHVIAGTDITLSARIPDTTLQRITIPNQTGLQVLEWLKEKLLLTVFFTGKELYVGIQEGVVKQVVKYQLGWNVIRDNNLKYRIADDNQIRVRIVKKLKKGEQILYETGDANGEIVKRTIPNWEEDDKLKQIAQKVLKEKKFTGFEGKISAFLEPYCELSDTAQIIDKKYGQRDGKYFVASTAVQFGMQGARRLIEITWRLDD